MIITPSHMRKTKEIPAIVRHLPLNSYSESNYVLLKPLTTRIPNIEKQVKGKSNK